MTKTATFSNDFLKEIKEVLLQEKTKLETELSKFTNKNPHTEGDFEATFPEYGDESDENAREVADYTTNKSLEITLEKTLRDINKSLARLEENTYGVCKYCDNPIEEKRLLARPTSGSCVDCKKTLTDEL
jgi:DnaK suppressor protein